MEGAVDSPTPCTTLIRWLSKLEPVTISEKMKGRVTTETAKAVATRCSAREPLIAKAIAVVDVRSVNDTTKVTRERPNMMGVTKSFVRNPSQLIKVNNTYTLNNGINVSKEHATTCPR